MSLRTRIARWISPEPLDLLARYERLVNPELLQLFERASTDGIFERTAPVQVTPPMGASLGLTGKFPSDESLVNGSLSTADLAARAIANRMAELEPVLKRRKIVTKGTIEEEILDDHVAIDRLRNPHPDFTLAQIMATSTRQLVSSGEAYWAKIRNGFGLPAAFQILQPGTVEPVVMGGMVRRYLLREADGRQRMVDPRDILRFWFPDPKTLYLSRGYLAPNWINHLGSLFAEEHLRNFFQHDATPSAYLQGRENATAPGNEARAAFEALWIQTHHRRLAKDRPPAFIPPGWEVKESAVQKGQELVPLLDFWMRSQLMNYGVPRSVLGEVVSGDRSSAETNQFVFDRHTVAPIAKVFSDTLTAKYAREFGPDLFFVFEGFNDQDKNFELLQEQSDIQNKIRSPQQILRDRGDDIEDAPWGEFPPGSIGDSPYTGEEPDPIEMGEFTDAGPSAPQAPEEDAEEEPEEGDDEDERGEPSLSRGNATLLRAFRLTTSRRARWEQTARVAAKKVFAAQLAALLREFERKRAPEHIPALSDLFALLDRFDFWQTLFEPVRRRAFASVAQQALAEVTAGAGSFVFSEAVERKLERAAANLVSNANTTTKIRLRETIIDGMAQGEGPGQIASRVQEVFKGRRRNAKAIARTEMLRATEGAQIEGWRQSGKVIRKRWNDSLDTRVRDAHVSVYFLANPVPLDDPFILADGLKGMHPGDETLPARDVVNCRCFMTTEQS